MTVLDCNVTLFDLVLQCYQVFVKDFSSLLPFLTVFLHSKHDELKRECTPPSADNAELCRDVQALFASLSDILQCWSTSQYFKREFQTAMHVFFQQYKVHLTYIMKNVDYLGDGRTAFKRPRFPGHSKLESKKQPNVILLCLEILLPVAEKLVSGEDRLLVDTCTSKLGMVWRENGGALLT